MPKSQIPGWVWLFTGIVAGIFISFLGYLADIKPEAAPDAPKGQQATEAPAEEAEDSESSGTRFDFYTLLPEREVIVPDEPEEEPDPDAEKTVYILQAGSFKTAKDADRLRARLILMGLDARVETVTVDGGDQWHRVQVGPFESRSKLANTRSRLISEGIDTMLMKKKG